MSYNYNSNGWTKDCKKFLEAYQLAINKGKEYYKLGDLILTGDSWDSLDRIYKLEELGIIKCIDKSDSTQEHLFITVGKL